MPFKNKNRRFRNYSIVRLFVAVFLFVGVVSVLSFLSKFVFAAPYTEVVKSIELTSQRSSFASNAPGSWHVAKSAQWIEEGKARITFDVDTVRKTADGSYTDIIMVIDNSGSMSGNKMTQVKSDATELIDSVLSNRNNKMALVSFNSTATKLSGFTNNKTNLISLVNNLNTPGDTNYYDGFKKAEEILQGYQKQSNRELIMLFLTDGFPNNQTPNEVAEYRALKQMYPYMTINGIQYEMGDEVLAPIANVSDNQFIANMSSLNNVLFEASVVPYVYENFTITDYIDNAYWDVESIDDIDASIGDVDLSYDGFTPKVTWAMNEMLMSGRSAQLTIVVTLKDNLNLPEGSFLPTNKSETITSGIPEVPNENAPSTLTPVLKSSYNVTYEPNLPSGCNNYTGTLPAEEAYDAFSVVQMSTNEISCNGYNFKGWEIAEGGPKILNDDYFKIISDDVTIRATWSKVSISKAMDGEVHEEVVATLARGNTINKTLKQLTGQTNPSTSTTNTTITAVKSADSMSAAQQANAQIISDTSSPAPIYAWFDDSDGTIYIYSDADKIMGNTDMSYMFYGVTNLTDISGVADWDTSSATGMNYTFRGNSKLVNIDALSGWNTSNVTNMAYMFDGNRALVYLDALASWDTSKVTTMQYMFAECANISNLDALANWDTSSVKNLNGMFREVNMSSASFSLEPISNWDTSKVTDMGNLFGYTNLRTVEALAGWDTSMVTSMSGMFAGTSFDNIDTLANWDTSKVSSMNNMFYMADITNIDGASSWNTASLTNMSGMFNYADSLVNIDGASNWNTSKVTDMGSLFMGATNLVNIDGASNWNTSKVKRINNMFYGAASGAYSLTNIDGLSNWDTSSVTDMSYMFSNNDAITNVDALADWDTSSVTNMSKLFRHSRSIANIDGMHDWDTSSVKDMSWMFYNNSGLMGIDALEDWDTSSVTDMSDMFKGVSSITDIDGVSSWNTSSVTDMSNMFNSVSSITDIDGVSSWNTSSVTNMSGMFYNDTLITDLSPLNNWNTSSVTNMSNIFANIPSTVTRPSWYNGT